MNRELKVLYATHFINVTADYLLIPIFALLITHITSKVQFVGMIFAIQYIISSIISLFVIRLKDGSHLDEYLLTTNYFIKGLGWLFLVFFQTMPMLILVQIMLGIASGIGSPSFGALISEHLDKNKHLSEWGDLVFIQNIAVGIGSITAGFMYSRFGFPAIFALMAAFEFTSFFVTHYGLQSRTSR